MYIKKSTLTYIMRTFFLIFANLSLAFSYSLYDMFDDWKREHQIVIDNNNEGHIYSNWVENHKYIEDMNSRNLTYKLGHNEFSGMNSEEFKDHFLLSEHYTGFIDNVNKIRKEVKELRCVVDCIHEDENNMEKITCVKGCFEEKNLLGVPESVNWVEKGAVTPVKNQGQCGSCWSFSTTGALEGAYFIKKGKLLSFSEQELVDCDNFKNGGKDHGCNGGLMDNAFKWIEKNDGLCLEKDYQYVSGETKTAGTCDKSCSPVEGSVITNYYDVPASSDSDMMYALSKQPVSVAIQADQKDFQLYKSGVFTGECGTKLDHGVLLVGYGSEENGDYYLLKNSWGETWGDEGYIKLGRGSEFNSGNGQCGVLMQGSYPEV